MTTAFVFPGQGSQSVGMLADFAQAGTQVRDTFAAASAVLGFDLWDVVANGPRERLDQTEVTQPAMLAAGVATWRMWLDADGSLPQCLAGHSLGEYTALVCGGAIEFDAAVDLVRQRAAAMQNAVAPGVGAMAAVLGLSDEQVEQACTAAATEYEVVEPVNYNAPGQVVVAGHAAAVNRAVEAARASGARRAVLLPVSVPSHSSLMQPAAHALEQAVATADLQTPTTTVVSSVDATVYRDAQHIRANLLSQVHQPVRWVATVNALVALGGGTVIECGPGKVLTGLNRRITKGSDTNCAAIIDPASLTDVQQMVKPQ